MTDNVATLEGYTAPVAASCHDHDHDHDLYLLVRPGTDFDSTFRAWDCDAQEFIRVDGWRYSIEELDV